MTGHQEGATATITIPEDAPVWVHSGGPLLEGTPGMSTSQGAWSLVYGRCVRQLTLRFVQRCMRPFKRLHA